MTDYYADGRLLQAKNALVGFDVAAWALDRVELRRSGRVLDAGCGWGRFSQPLLARAPDVDLACTDLRPGMVASCRANVPGAGFAAADVERLPFAAATFDLVLANHMLYELVDPRAAIAELARVVSPDGAVMATTYADRPVPLLSFHRRALAAVGLPAPTEPSASFSLENGEPLLRTAFASVEVHTIDVAEPVDVDAITAVYERTGRFTSVGTTELLDAFRREAESAVGEWSTTTWTMFVARQPTL